jgi:hypothetical protein
MTQQEQAGDYEPDSGEKHKFSLWPDFGNNGEFFGTVDDNMAGPLLHNRYVGSGQLKIKFIPDWMRQTE